MKIIIPVISLLALMASSASARERYTETFPGYSAFDLEGLSLTFTPDGSSNYYSAEAVAITELPVPNSSQTAVEITDDGYGRVDLNRTFVFYGTSWSHANIGANGYLTFTELDGDFTASLDEHFETPRISTFWDDWNPAAGGTVMYGLLGDRFVVTFDEVWEFGTPSSNPMTGTFQTELFYDGRIRMSWLNIDNSNPYALVGLSDGTGLPSVFTITDLSHYARDIDLDGLLDSWERDHFGTIGAQAATNNPDGDLHDNMAEYICGSNPKDPDSYFTAALEAGSSGPIVRWTAVEGRTYCVFKSENLALESFQLCQSGLAYPVNAYTDTVAGATGCYTVEVELEE